MMWTQHWQGGNRLRAAQSRNWPFVLAVASLLATLSPAPGGAQDPSGEIEQALFGTEAAVTYEVAVEGLPEALSPALLEGALRIYRFQKDGASSLALLQRRAESDIERVERILRSEGYYEGTARVRVAWAGEEPAAKAAESGAKNSDDKNDDAQSGDSGKSPRAAVVTLAIEPGHPFTLAAHAFEPSGLTPDAAEPLDPKALGSPVGRRAEARAILAAENAAIDRLRRAGRPYAALARREATADLDAATLTVRSVIAPGPRAVFGPVRIEGAGDVETGYLLTYQPWKEGETFDDSDLAAFQQALVGTELFRAVTVKKPEHPGETAPGDPPLALPVTVAGEPAPRRSVGLGARYATDSGPEARVSFEHRNLFGANERFRAALQGGIEDQKLELELRKPQFRRAGQDLVTALTLRQEKDDAFDEQAATGSIGLERALGTYWGGKATGGFGLLGEASRIEDALGSSGHIEPEETAYLLGLPAFLSLDARDDKLDPSKGFQLKATATPFVGLFDDEETEFLALGLEGAAYHALDDSRRFILAGRGRLGVIFSEDLASVPSPRRLFSGGGGSVRGYAERFAGPLDAAGDPIGGRSVIELGAELRFKATETLGGVLFADAGTVTDAPGAFFDEPLRIGVGPGLRYYSPIGPVGVDIGLPIDPRPQDDPFQLYFSIGQSF